MRLVTNPNDPELGRGIDKDKTPQHSKYLVLSTEELSKGFIRPVRDTYVHVGKKIERDIEGRIIGRLIQIDDQDYPKSDYYTKANGFSGYIMYPKNHDVIGRYLSKEEVEAIISRKTHFGGCGVATKMGRWLSETYASSPSFYGATYCVGCEKHLAVEEFIWDDNEVVGS